MVKLLLETNPPQTAIGYLGFQVCSKCCGMGYEVKVFYDDIAGSGSYAVGEPDARVYAPVGKTLRLLRIRWVCFACFACRGFRLRTRYAETKGRALDALRRLDELRRVEAMRGLVLMLAVFLGACTAPAPDIPWHLELVDGVVIVAGGHGPYVEPVRLDVELPRGPTYWTWYDQAAWSEVRAVVLREVYDATR